MIGYTELALDDTEKGSQLHNNLHEVLIAGKRARDLVKQILTFSRQAHQELKPLKIQLVVKEALKLIRSSLPSTIEINQDISNTCGFVLADVTQIHQVVLNLLTNAYHALEDKGGTVDITLKEIQLDMDDLKDPTMIPGPYVCLTVADTGAGIDGYVLDRIFEPYFSTKEKDKGTGLGLAMVHGIVKSYGGNIRIYSEPGKGSAFHVYLPVIQTQAEREELDVVLPVEGGTERILLVDDEVQIVRMEQQMLERLGYHVTVRTSSIEALEAFRAVPDNFDLVITDMTMPNMTGVELAKKIIEIRPDIPMIICTGFSEKISENKAITMGIRGYVMKPVVKSELAKKIREVLDRI
jgi:CheY-like chemotaxis protein